MDHKLISLLAAALDAGAKAAAVSEGCGPAWVVSRALWGASKHLQMAAKKLKEASDGTD